MRAAVAVVVGAMVMAPLVAGAEDAFVDTCRVDADNPTVILSGRITDPGEGTLSGAIVILRCGAFRQEARTAADGTYRLTAPAGSYMLDADAPGFEPWFQTLELEAPGPQTLDLTLQVGAFASIVTVSERGGFVAGTSTTATKTDAPLIEIPQSVSVITEDQMTARNVQTVNEAIRYTGSVDVDTYGTETRYDWINIRGFDQSTYGLYRDNSRWQSGQVSGQIDPYLLQEVDVVKGPSSVLYGQNQPGGLVNLVTKRPPRSSRNEVVLNYGEYSRVQAQLDLGGPLDPDGRWRYRLVALYRDSDTQVDYVPDNRWLIAPALTWAPSDRTTLTFLADFQRDETGWSQFLPSEGTFRDNPNGRISRSTFTGEPGYDYFDRDQWSVGTLFEHRFDANWTLRNTLRYSSIEYDGKNVFGGGLQEDMRTLNRFGFGNSLDLGLLTTDTNVYVVATTGAVEHGILVGVDYSSSESNIVSGFAVAPAIDIYDPVYGAEIPDLFTYYDTRQPVTLLGLYVQDHMKIGDHLVATLAGRHDWTTIVTDDSIAGTRVEQDPTETTGRVGLTYVTDVGVAPYFSYSTSFLPVSGVDFFGQPFEPTTGTQLEGGVKFQPRHSNSFITASVYEITQENVSVPDPTNPLNTLQEGEVRSRGWELEAVGHVAGGLSFHAAYSSLDQEVTETTDPAVLGKRPPLAPDELLSAGGEYTITSGPLSGLGLGVGVRYVGERAGDSLNTIIVPDYTLFDASVRYLWNQMEFQLSATNLTDEVYVAVCTSPSYCNYGNARQVIGTVRYRWQTW